MLAAAAAVAIAVVMPLAGAPPASAAPAQAEETIGQFNMAGGHEDNADNGLEPAEALVKSVNDRNPAFMTLQETCSNWTDYMGAELQENYEVMPNWVRRSAGGEYATCKNGHLFGNALLVRRDMGFSRLSLVDHQLGTRSNLEQREMLCASSASRDLAVCSTHLTPDNDEDPGRDEVREAEAQEAQETLDASYPGRTRVLGGDLNDSTLSDTTSNFYAPGYGFGADGVFKETMSPCRNVVAVWWPSLPLIPCRSGERTHNSGTKIDYLFAETGLTVTWSDVTDALHSDHRLVWARVTGL